MKMYLMTFDEACKTFSKKHSKQISFIDGCIYEIGKDSMHFQYPQMPGS